MKKIILNLFKLFYKQMDLSVSYSIKSLMIIFFYQKIRGINRRVQWPVHHTSVIKNYNRINKQTNKNPGIAAGCYIDARNGIVLEENVWIGPHVSIISQNHSLLDYEEYLENKPIVIKKNSILLCGSIILPGIELGEHTVVAAGSVVTKSFPDKNQLIGGNPAKLIKNLEEYKDKLSKNDN
jgi:acetyltransferase-like isoleucine patch superfamily enzyme